MPEKVLEFVDMSAAMAEKAASVLSQQEQMEKQAADLIPTAVDELLKAKLIEPEEKQAALVALKDPVRTLQILIKTVTRQAGRQLDHARPAGQQRLPRNEPNGVENRAVTPDVVTARLRSPRATASSASRLMGGN